MDTRAAVAARGFFLHSTDGSELETGEHKNAEGVATRVRIVRSPAPNNLAAVARPA
jgi:hypothetical protein